MGLERCSKSAVPWVTVRAWCLRVRLRFTAVRCPKWCSSQRRSRRRRRTARRRRSASCWWPTTRGRIRRRAFSAVATSHGASRQTQRRRIVVRQRDHQRAGERRGIGLPGRTVDADVGDLAGERRRRLHPRARLFRRSARLEPIDQPARLVGHRRRDGGARTGGRSAAAARIRWERDPRITRLVDTWPGTLDANGPASWDFPCDQNFDAIVRAYVDSLGALRL